ncbi:MAG: tRNA(Ile)-lysidine synthetase [Bacteroidetes bacterium]|nr:tRNA(Ile)-lysidine synthetase [Bacteroidota bacterium]
MKSPLIHKVKSLLTEQQINLSAKRVLLALSGGIDSVVLAEVFHQMGVDFGIAHCNFQLRGEESDGDEALARALADKYKVEFHTKKFDTTKYVADYKVSTQVAARDLRYEWLESVRKSNAWHYLATAHHLNDNIETVLHNFIKGTGIKGLRGMLPKSGILIRPLLNVSRDEIEVFQKENNLTYREDSSNASDKYTRNKIRHHLVTLIEDINPGFEAGFIDRIKVFSDLEALYNAKVRKIDKQLFQKRGNDIYIPILKLRKLTNKRSILFEYLNPYGYNSSQVDDILSALDSESGKQFLSPAARIIKDRQFLILTEAAQTDFMAILIEKEETEVKLKGSDIRLSQEKAADLVIKKNKSHAYLDLDKLEFPLMLRQWKKGDYFYPFGMKLKKKKVSKYFKDQKIPIHEKETIWILESGKKVVWIVGERTDERYKITDKTKQVLVLHQIKA